MENREFEESVHSLVNETVLHGSGDHLCCAVAEPIVGVPGVDEPDLVSCSLSEVFIVVDEYVTFHHLCFPFVLCVNPQNARKSPVYFFERENMLIILEPFTVLRCNN